MFPCRQAALASPARAHHSLSLFLVVMIIIIMITLVIMMIIIIIIIIIIIKITIIIMFPFHKKILWHQYDERWSVSVFHSFPSSIKNTFP